MAVRRHRFDYTSRSIFHGIDKTVESPGAAPSLSLSDVYPAPDGHTFRFPDSSTLVMVIAGLSHQRRPYISGKDPHDGPDSAYRVSAMGRANPQCRTTSRRLSGSLAGVVGLEKLGSDTHAYRHRHGLLRCGRRANDQSRFEQLLFAAKRFQVRLLLYHRAAR